MLVVKVLRVVVAVVIVVRVWVGLDDVVAHEVDGAKRRVSGENLTEAGRTTYFSPVTSNMTASPSTKVRSRVACSI